MAHPFQAEKVRSLIRSREYDQAKLACEIALAEHAIEPTERATALQLLGTCFYFSGDLNHGVECFKQVLEIDPKHTDASLSLSIIYNDLGRYDEAKKIYQMANQALQNKRTGTDNVLDRKFAIKHIELGDLYFKFHRYDEAMDDYGKAFRLDPLDVSLRIKISRCHAKKGHTTRAIQELQQLCHERSDLHEARIQLGLLHFSQGNVIDAQMEWEKVAQNAPDLVEVHTYLDMARKATETKL